MSLSRTVWSHGLGNDDRRIPGFNITTTIASRYTSQRRQLFLAQNHAQCNQPQLHYVTCYIMSRC